MVAAVAQPQVEWDEHAVAGDQQDGGGHGTAERPEENVSQNDAEQTGEQPDVATEQGRPPRVRRDGSPGAGWRQPDPSSRWARCHARYWRTARRCSSHVRLKRCPPAPSATKYMASKSGSGHSTASRACRPGLLIGP